jgi:hypothetical protein
VSFIFGSASFPVTSTLASHGRLIPRSFRSLHSTATILAFTNLVASASSGGVPSTSNLFADTALLSASLSNVYNVSTICFFQSPQYFPPKVYDFTMRSSPNDRNFVDYNDRARFHDCTCSIS